MNTTSRRLKSPTAAWRVFIAPAARQAGEYETETVGLTDSEIVAKLATIRFALGRG
jgi:hypothetical protein